jgi:hypothetical protein
MASTDVQKWGCYFSSFDIDSIILLSMHRVCGLAFCHRSLFGVLLDFDRQLESRAPKRASLHSLMIFCTSEIRPVQMWQIEAMLLEAVR